MTASTATTATATTATGASAAAAAAAAAAADATAAAEATIREIAPWIERAARGGYAARGVVYLTIGALAAAAALGLGGGTTDMHGALRALGGIVAGTLGRVLLAALALGLLGYTAWRLVLALTDPERRRDGWHRPFVRLGYLVSAGIHAQLAVEAARLALGLGHARGHFARRAIAWGLGVPLGRWLVVGVGAGIAVYGLAQLWRAAFRDVCRRLDFGALGPQGCRTIRLLGRVGIASRGLVFLVLGWLLVQAARHVDPAAADSIADALRSIGRWRPGAPLGGVFALVALGLAAFGAWELLQARYRRIRPVRRA
ncbi:MAG TPA: DUF1206 domain-containing protein [Gemmatimonadales bacterium]|nr:DUF1206 domain-containing protein [Gemmatimonadales bacterium]